jgi:hypothetical protein
MEKLPKEEKPPVDMAFSLCAIFPNGKTAINGQPQMNVIVQSGMTLRDYFAAQALSMKQMQEFDLSETGAIAAWAYSIADSMVNIRQEKNLPYIP